MVLAGLDAFADEFASHGGGRLRSRHAPDGALRHAVSAHVNVPGLHRAGRGRPPCRGGEDDPQGQSLPRPARFVCEHPCEERCRRTMVDAPVNIRGIKKYIVDTVAADTVETPAPLPATGKRVAVVGAGPSGLTCASWGSWVIR